jgi:hypothetical protein
MRGPYVALVEQTGVVRFGTGISEAIAHVEAGGMPTLAVAGMRRNCDLRFRRADRGHAQPGFPDEAVDGSCGFFHVRLSQPRYGPRRFPCTEGAIAAVVMPLDRIGKRVRFRLAIHDRDDGGGVDEDGQSSSSSLSES